jgi:DNA-binding PadR family transcriptional regulator
MEGSLCTKRMKIERLNMKDSFNNRFRERILRAFLDVAVLARLEDKAMNGYELTVFFMKKFGVAVSTSTVYSTLYLMERNELVEGSYRRRSRTYELTEKGRETLEAARQAVKENQMFIKTLLKSQTYA